MYQLPPHIHDTVRQSVLITGSARSGTSIFGKLLGSLERVEYFFEPPTLFSLFAMLDDLPGREARVLFDTFLYEELLIGALSGRAINLRSQDDSSIHHIKPAAEIIRRLEVAARKTEMDASSSVIVIKLPDFVNRLNTITRVLGVRRLLISVRDPASTISSLLRRGWFTDAALLAGDITWPNRFEGRVPRPHWVPSGWQSAWDKMGEADRAALYYISQTDLPIELPETTLVFDYNQLVTQPRALLATVAHTLSLDFGPCTDGILEQVKVQETTQDFALNLLSSELCDRVQKVYARATSRCLSL
jgi:hypothetical protein